MERTTATTSDNKTAKPGARKKGAEAREGELTKRVESFTAQIPSLAYLGLAVGSMILSASLAGFTRRKTFATFVGLWVPTIMLVGVYNKLVKLEGSDRFSRGTVH